MRWSLEVADLWTGTLYEKQILLERERLSETIRSGDMKAIERESSDLAQFLNQAETEYERADELQKSR